MKYFVALLTIGAVLAIGFLIGVRFRPDESRGIEQKGPSRQELEAALKRAAEADADTARLLEVIERAKLNDALPDRRGTARQTPAEQFDARKAEADALWQAGRTQEALAAYLWCYENGPTKDRYARGHIRRVLAMMAKNYPPAFAAMEALRDAAHHKALANPADTDTFQEALMLNRDLGDKARNLQLFDGLRDGDPRKKQASIVAFDLLVEERRYQDAVKIKSLGAMLSALDIWAENVQKTPSSRAQVALTEAIANDVEALAGAGKLEDAKMLVNRFLEIDPTGKARGIVEQRLTRVGRTELLNSAPH